LHRYWDLEWAPDYSRSEEALAEELRGRLEESVRLHLVSDVPLGAFLSGGVDSSSVVATMARLTDQPVKTFSIGFAEDDYNELNHARMVARTFGTDHRELVLKPDVLSVVEDLAWFLDEPFGDPSAIPTYMVSKLASEHVTVALSGDGGDELFGGYDRYRVEARERRLERLPGAVRRMLGAVAAKAPEATKGRGFLRHMALDGLARYQDACTYFRLEEQKALFRPDTFALVSAGDPGPDPTSRAGGNGHWLSSVQHMDLGGYLPLDILTKVDRMSMAHSLEARVPLLDHELIEFAATIPPELQMRHGTTKYIFKRALRGILPDAIIDRPKQGFAVPLGRWFRGGLGEFVRELLFSAEARQRGLFEPAYLDTLLDRHERGRNLDSQLWTLISFELWARRFLDGGASAPAVVDHHAPFVVGPSAPHPAGRTRAVGPVEAPRT
jgi:asparagine synthase (glutamine-hydrolysing)